MSEALESGRRAQKHCPSQPHERPPPSTTKHRHTRTSRHAAQYILQAAVSAARAGGALMLAIEPSVKTAMHTRIHSYFIDRWRNSKRQT